ncbi:MAG: hypothetical protein CBE14_001910 [Rickettsiales bacterium TMED254]|nr:MAG: hypothetical protein CBE14_001910 [Rickettsiales bacterium TMED254]|tara:strand:- start:17 stop:286 length:270 start_codon:yes stop_codon:yes gene_type:complete
MSLNENDPEPLRYYDWIGWKLRQEEQKKKQANMQSDNIEMSGWNKNALDYGNTHELNRIADSWKGVSNQLNRIEVKLDHILARLDGGLK